MKIRPKVVN